MGNNSSDKMLIKSAPIHKILTQSHIIIRKINLLSDKAYIGGQWVSAKSRKVFPVINPANEEVINCVPDLDAEDTQVAIECAAETFKTWKKTSALERSKLMRKWLNTLEKHEYDLAQIVTAETGKPFSESINEIKYGNAYVEWFCEQARNIRGEIIPSPVASRKLLVDHCPIGVASLITPWNFPHAMVTRKISPALATGCTCVIKPSEDTPLTALALMNLAEEAGIPEGVLNVVTSSRENVSAVGKVLCESPLVAGISFTGSTEVGKALYKQCAGGVKRMSLELGGNAPFIVYKSANIEKAVEGAIASKFRNCGQTCVSANRFLIQDKVFDEFVCLLLEKVQKIKMGNGMDKSVTMGPLINQAQFNKISKLVTDACLNGGQILFGGKASELGKLFYEPTVIANVNEKMKIYTEEVFGPIVSLIRFETEEESLDIANCTRRGLAGYFFSQDMKQIFRVAQKLEVGMVGVNEGRVSAVEAPFGGIKESGIGREGSHHGIEEYTYLKYTCLGDLQ